MTTPSPTHDVLCPICLIDLVETVRNEIQLDVCPHCRGAWIQRRDINKIIARSEREGLFIDERTSPRIGLARFLPGKKIRINFLRELFR